MVPTLSTNSLTNLTPNSRLRIDLDLFVTALVNNQDVFEATSCPLRLNVSGRLRFNSNGNGNSHPFRMNTVLPAGTTIGPVFTNLVVETNNPLTVSANATSNNVRFIDTMTNTDKNVAHVALVGGTGYNLNAAIII